VKSEKIYINGYIGEAGFFDNASNSFSLNSLNSILDTIGDVSELNIYINSGGGSVTEGFAIYDRLASLPYTVNTIVNGMCGSIATVIYQAGKKGKRKMYANSEFFVHNPFWQPSAPDPMEAKDLALLQQDLQNAENKIKAFYVTVTGKTVDELTPLLDRQTTMSASEAIELGFADEIVDTNITAFTKYRLVAYINNNNKNSEMENKELKAEIGGIKGLLNKISKALFKNAYTETVDGMKIYFEGTMVMKDTPVFSDEAMSTPLPDGDYTLDSMVITVVGGIVTVVSEAQPSEGNADLANANAKIAELEAKLAEKDDLVAEKEGVINATQNDIVALAKKVKSFEALIVTGADFQANGGQAQGKAEPAEPTETPMQKVARMRAEKELKK
jgi:ATP-dependent Clp endopeptidase proteolytic subunit ClpP